MLDENGGNNTQTTPSHSCSLGSYHWAGRCRCRCPSTTRCLAARQDHSLSPARSHRSDRNRGRPNGSQGLSSDADNRPAHHCSNGSLWRHRLHDPQRKGPIEWWMHGPGLDFGARRNSRYRLVKARSVPDRPEWVVVVGCNISGGLHGL